MPDHSTDQVVRIEGRPRFAVSLGAVVVLVLVAIAAAVLISATASAGASEVIEVEPSGSSQGSSGGVTDLDVPAADDAGEPLLVHVLGAVRAPGLYQLDEGARLVDAVAAAGGLADDADPAAVNLARRVADGEQVVVPRVGEASAPPAAGEAASVDGSMSAPVSLGTALSEQLQTLPRIGPALAARIIAWRDAGGRFRSVDDLLEVPGIGQGTVDGLRELAVP